MIGKRLWKRASAARKLRLAPGLRCVSASRAVAALLVCVLAACAPRTSESPDPVSVAPAMRLAGQRVLVLPVQTAAGISPEQRPRATAELMFALAEREPRVIWIAPAELERALRRSPGYAADPALLPADPMLHHGERRITDPLASELRRYSALIDARLVLLPHEIRAAPRGDTARALQLHAALVDARTGDILWWGAGETQVAGEPGSREIAGAAAQLAERLVAVPAAEVRP